MITIAPDLVHTLAEPNEAGMPQLFRQRSETLFTTTTPFDMTVQ
ncbi:hypothetical protein [Paractinoplanes atraurantiacus]|uniref:Uncharacterized protein n=1 Tax=Paractinoplanes atraurantiacus TaxID=1036182 RepID=A0A285JFU9_9ACTN|nr:hypothetical protein [Actinoplanes atraurantiacus]SNY59125.1 hypothetical protein SAMN05421748_12047 [Actinoplanes atraurantiacus]